MTGVNNNILRTLLSLVATFLVLWLLTVAFLIWHQPIEMRRYDELSDYYLRLTEVSRNLGRELSRIEKTLMGRESWSTSDLAQFASDEIYLVRRYSRKIASIEGGLAKPRDGAHARLVEAFRQFEALAGVVETGDIDRRALLGEVGNFRERAEQLSLLRQGQAFDLRDERHAEAATERRNALILLAGLLAIGLFAFFRAWRQIRMILTREAAYSAEISELNRTLEARVDARTAELHEAQAQMVRKERLAAVGQVTATVSHELRNPLGAIRNATYAIKKFASDEDPRMERALALLERAQTRCDTVIDDLLNFTRVQEARCEPTKLDDWLGSVLGELALPPNIMLRSSLNCGVEVDIDRDRIRRAVDNVLQNARHAMEAGAEDDPLSTRLYLDVATRVDGDRLELSITDTGGGITEKNMSGIFEPLFSTKAIGTGLGLPLVKQTMEMHGGGVAVSSEVGRGTEVVLWLPLADRGVKNEPMDGVVK